LPAPGLRGPVRPRRVVARIVWVLLRVALRSLQDQLLPLATAEPADRTRVTSHVGPSSPLYSRVTSPGLPPARRPGGLHPAPCRPRPGGPTSARQTSDPPLLRRTAAVVRDRRHIPDGLHLQPRRRQ